MTSSSSSSVSSLSLSTVAHLKLLPKSPIKMNVLSCNSGLFNNANLLKVTSVAAKADSTNTTDLTIDPKTGVPFKRHHHSVKKFQTPSVSRRNARERNRVKQVNLMFYYIYIDYL